MKTLLAIALVMAVSTVNAENVKQTDTEKELQKIQTEMENNAPKSKLEKALASFKKYKDKKANN